MHLNFIPCYGPQLEIKYLILSYDFYDMTLSTGKQRRHMINTHKNVAPRRMSYVSRSMSHVCSRMHDVRVTYLSYLDTP